MGFHREIAEKRYDAIASCMELFRERGFSVDYRSSDERISYDIQKEENGKKLCLSFINYGLNISSLFNTIALQFSVDGEQIAKVDWNFFSPVSSSSYSTSVNLGNSEVFSISQVSIYNYICNFNDEKGNKVNLEFTNCCYQDRNIVNSNFNDPYNFRFSFIDKNGLSKCYEILKSKEKIYFNMYSDKNKRCLFSFKAKVDDAAYGLLHEEDVRKAIDKLSLKSKKDDNIIKCIVALELILEHIYAEKSLTNESSDLYSCKNIVGKTRKEICQFVLDNEDKLLNPEIKASSKLQELINICSGGNVQGVSSHNDCDLAYTDIPK